MIGLVSPIAPTTGFVSAQAIVPASRQQHPMLRASRSASPIDFSHDSSRWPVSGSLVFTIAVREKLQQLLAVFVVPGVFQQRLAAAWSRQVDGHDLANAGVGPVRH